MILFVYFKGVVFCGIGDPTSLWLDGICLYAVKAENELISILNVCNKRLTGPAPSKRDPDMALGLCGITAMGTIVCRG